MSNINDRRSYTRILATCGYCKRTNLRHTLATLNANELQFLEPGKYYSDDDFCEDCIKEIAFRMKFSQQLNAPKIGSFSEEAKRSKLQFLISSIRDLISVLFFFCLQLHHREGVRRSETAFKFRSSSQSMHHREPQEAAATPPPPPAPFPAHNRRPWNEWIIQTSPLRRSGIRASEIQSSSQSMRCLEK